LSKPSIMRVPEIVLTTVYETLLDGFLLHARIIAGAKEIRYESLYESRSSRAFWYSA
jgi:hypothetical protein